MKKLLTGLTGFFGLIPGVTIMQSGLGVPPEKGYNLLFGGVVEAAGVITLLILWINREKLKNWSKVTITWIGVSLGLAFLFVLVFYLVLLGFCVVINDPRGTIYYPLWTTGEVAEMIETAGSRWAAIDSYGRYAVYRGIAQMGPVPALLTTNLFLFLYLGVFTTLTLAIGILALYKTK